MRIGELAARAEVSVKAVRYYERLGLIEPARQANGYRVFDEHDLRAVIEVRELSEIGISPLKAAPFIECLDTGHQHGDECVSSLAVYRDTIAELDRMIDALSTRRASLRGRLEQGAGRTFARAAGATEAAGAHAAPAAAEPTESTEPTGADDYTTLPEGLPVPEDDGAADHLRGRALPDVELPLSDGSTVALARLGSGRTVIYLYPLTGRPGTDLPAGWESIPGARGCSTEACSFRDHFQQLRAAGAARVYGFSSQDPAYQAEVVDRLRLPFGMISDELLVLADALALPTFSAPGHARLYSRLTLVIRDGAIEHVFYPIFPPNTHAQQVLGWLEEHPVSEES